MTPYEQMANSIIEKQVMVLGRSIALVRAQRVGGLELESDGRVKKIVGNDVEVLEKLIDEYRTILGPAAISFAKDASLPIIKQHSGLALPRALQE